MCESNWPRVGDRVKTAVSRSKPVVGTVVEVRKSTVRVEWDERKPGQEWAHRTIIETWALEPWAGDSDG